MHERHFNWEELCRSIGSASSWHNSETTAYHRSAEETYGGNYTFTDQKTQLQSNENHGSHLSVDEGAKDYGE